MLGKPALGRLRGSSVRALPLCYLGAALVSACALAKHGPPDLAEGNARAMNDEDDFGRWEWGRSDPAACVDPPTTEEKARAAWTEEVGRRLDAELPGLVSCSRGSGSVEQARFSIRLIFDHDGKSGDHEIKQSAPADCPVAACVRRRLRSMRAPPGSQASNVFIAHLALQRGTEPRRLRAALPADSRGTDGGPEQGTCVDEPSLATSARLDPELIQETIRSQYDDLRACYERALAGNRNASGVVTVRFVIAKNGQVREARATANSLPDCGAVQCMLSVFRGLSFPEPNPPGIVTVVYPIRYAPGDPTLVEGTRPWLKARTRFRSPTGRGLGVGPEARVTKTTSAYGLDAPERPLVPMRRRDRSSPGSARGRVRDHASLHAAAVSAPAVQSHQPGFRLLSRSGCGADRGASPRGGGPVEPLARRRQ